MASARHERYAASLLQLDPDLGPLLSVERLVAARNAFTVVVHPLGIGECAMSRLGRIGHGHIGLFLVDGAMACRVLVEDSVSTELLGPGDVVRPWVVRSAGQILQHDIRWTAITECHVALLDRRFAAQLTRFPEVNAALLERIAARGERLAVTKAIAQLNRVERRLLALFWHIAERWGRVTADGIAIPLTLPHRLLGEIVGARRPTVSTALGDLARAGRLMRRSDGTWMLTREPTAAPSPDGGRFVPFRRRLPADSPTTVLEEVGRGEPV